MDDPIFAKAGRYKGRFFALVYGNAKVPKQELYTYLITNIKPAKGKTPIIFVGANSPFYNGEHMIALIDFHEKVDRSDFTRFNYEVHIPFLRRFDDWLKIIGEVEASDPDIYPPRNQTAVEGNAVIPQMYNCRLPNGVIATPPPVVTRKCSACQKYIEVSAFAEQSSACKPCSKAANAASKAGPKNFNSEEASFGTGINTFNSDNASILTRIKNIEAAFHKLTSDLNHIIGSIPTSGACIPFLRPVIFDTNMGLAFFNFGDAERIIGRNTNFDVNTEDKFFIVFEFTQNKNATLEKYKKSFESNRFVNYMLDSFVNVDLTGRTEILAEILTMTGRSYGNIQTVSEDDYGNTYDRVSTFGILMNKRKTDLFKYLVFNNRKLV